MSLYRNAIWFLKGIHEYTRNGFEAASTHFEERDLDISVAGRSFLITGANGGIGKATAIAIAKKVCRLPTPLLCRWYERAEEAREEIYREAGNTEVYIHILDMFETRKVWEFVESFKKRHRLLNVLINNAGCLVNQREVNTEGLDKNIAANTLGVYVLTEGLIPLLKRNGNPRVITVSSGSMLVQKLRTTDLQSEKGDYDGTMVYAQNKRQQVVMTEKWAKAHGSIHFSSMHPGWADTPAVAEVLPRLHRSMQGHLRTVEQGADTVVWLAVSKAAAATPSGKFFQDRAAVPTHLPLAWTRSSPEEEQDFMAQLDALAKSCRPPAVTRSGLANPPYERFCTKPTLPF